MAKVTRDRIMDIYDKVYRNTGLSGIKDNPTDVHRQALQKFGPSAIHRMTFFAMSKQKLDTFGGVLLRSTQDTSKDTEPRRSETPTFRAGKKYAALSINPETNLSLNTSGSRRIELGKAGEEAALGFLKQSGYKILNKNYPDPLRRKSILLPKTGILSVS